MEQVIKNTQEIKKDLWKAKRLEIDQIVDGLGMPIDEGIKDTVIVLQLLGLDTFSSHEGKLDGYAVPYVDIKSREVGPLEKEWELELDRLMSDEEKSLRRKIRELWNKNYSYDDATHSEAKKLEAEADELQLSLEQFPEKKSEKMDDLNQSIRAINLEARKTVIDYLEKFYSNRDSDPEYRLVVEPFGFERTRLTVASEEIQKNEQDEKKREQRLLGFQKEMNDFTEFLKTEFYK